MALSFGHSSRRPGRPLPRSDEATIRFSDGRFEAEFGSPRPLESRKRLKRNHYVSLFGSPLSATLFVPPRVIGTDPVALWIPANGMNRRLPVVRARMAPIGGLSPICDPSAGGFEPSSQECPP